MTETLGKATLELSVGNLGEFDKGIDSSKKSADSLDERLDILAATSKLATDALQRIRMTAEQASTTAGLSDEMKAKLAEIGVVAEATRADIERVKIGARQAAESDVAGDVIDRKLEDIKRNADQARHALDRLRLSGVDIGGGGGRGNIERDLEGGGGGGGGEGAAAFVGASPGLLGLIGAGVLAAPSAGPGILGLLAAIPAMGAVAGGVIGTLVLGFKGMGAAIGGDKAAYEKLQPAQKQFVLTVRSLTGWIDKLKQVAGQSLFGGLTKGLKAALSPGTLSAITAAVKEFGTAIGGAGEQWGKYFGSKEFQSIFGPLMRSAAGQLGILSRAAQSFFDALGVLGRAAIPFTTWLDNTIAKGMKWFDAFMHAKEASGALAHSLDNAKSSLTLVAKLVEALWKATYSLGKALYPVSQVFVKDLISGLNGLAGVLDRNQKTIQAFVGTLIAGIRIAVVGVSEGLGLITRGWNAVFGHGGSLVTEVAAAGLAITLIFGPEAAIVVAALLAAGYITDHWGSVKIWFDAFAAYLPKLMGGMWKAVKGLADDAVYALLLPVKGIADGLKSALGWVPGVGGKISSAANSTNAFVNQFKNAGSSDFSSADASIAGGFSQALARGEVEQAALDRLNRQRAAISAALAKAKNAKAKAAWDAMWKSLSGSFSGAGSAFGPLPPWTSTTTGQTTSASSFLNKVLPLSLQSALNIAKTGAASGSVSGLQRLLDVAKLTLGYLDKEKATGEKLVELTSERLTLSGLVASTEAKIAAIPILAPSLQAALSVAKGGAASGTLPGLKQLLDVTKLIQNYLEKQTATGARLVKLAAQRATLSALAASTEAKIVALQLRIPPSLLTAITNAKTALSGTSSSLTDSSTIEARVTAMKQLVVAEAKELAYLRAERPVSEALAKVEAQRSTAAAALRLSTAALRKETAEGKTARREEGILGIGGNGNVTASALRQSVRSLLIKRLEKDGASALQVTGLSLTRLIDMAKKKIGVDFPKSTLTSLEKINAVLKNNLLPADVTQDIRNRVAQINQTLSTVTDGFDLTAAEAHRHILDQRRANRYLDDTAAAKAKRGAGDMVYAPTYNVPDEATARRKDRQQFFRFRQLLPGT